MADADPQADTAIISPASVEAHYRAWQYAKARWEVAIYAPEMAGEDLPEAIANPLMGAEAEAFERLMTAPCQTPGELSRKLEVFRDKDGCSLEDGGIYIAILAQDARRLPLKQH